MKKIKGPFRKHIRSHLRKENHAGQVVIWTGSFIRILLVEMKIINLKRAEFKGTLKIREKNDVAG